METLTRIKMNTTEQIDVILQNMCIMLYNRGYIKNVKSTFENLKKISSKNKFSWKENDKEFLILIEFQKINGIKKSSEIETSLVKSKADYKFLIVEQSTNKTYTQINNFKTELFLTDELLVDVASIPYIPKHELLNDKTKETLLGIYKEHDLPKIFTTDRMVRYLGAKVGDIIKITRPTINSGESVYYRKVVHKNR